MIGSRFVIKWNWQKVRMCQELLQPSYLLRARSKTHLDKKRLNKIAEGHMSYYDRTQKINAGNAAVPILVSHISFSISLGHVTAEH